MYCIGATSFLSRLFRRPRCCFDWRGLRKRGQEIRNKGLTESRANNDLWNLWSKDFTLHLNAIKTIFEIQELIDFVLSRDWSDQWSGFRKKGQHPVKHNPSPEEAKGMLNRFLTMQQTVLSSYLKYFAINHVVVAWSISLTANNLAYLTKWGLQRGIRGRGTFVEEHWNL